MYPATIENNAPTKNAIAVLILKKIAMAINTALHPDIEGENILAIVS